MGCPEAHLDRNHTRNHNRLIECFGHRYRMQRASECAACLEVLVAKKCINPAESGTAISCAGSRCSRALSAASLRVKSIKNRPGTAQSLQSGGNRDCDYGISKSRRSTLVCSRGPRPRSAITDRGYTILSGTLMTLRQCTAQEPQTDYDYEQEYERLRVITGCPVSELRRKNAYNTKTEFIMFSLCDPRVPLRL